MERNEFQSWNRPVWKWSLECEEEGSTRQTAFEKTQLTLSSSGHETHIEACGLALVIMLPILLCASGCAFAFSKGEMMASVAALCCCNRFCWLIIGPIIMTSLAEMDKAAQDNMSVADEFDIINDCADSKAYVDSNAIKAIQLDQIDFITNLNILCIAAFAIFGIELCCGFGIFCCSALSCKCNRGGRTSCSDFC